MKTFSKSLGISCLIAMCTIAVVYAETSSLRRTPTVIAVEKISPAVVNISTEKIVQSRSSLGFSGDPFFDQFFRDFLDPFPRRQYKQNSLGSGVIFDKRGYVLTNHHVIQRASKITITLTDNREFEAELIGDDVRFDLAVVKISSAENLPIAELGRSDDLMIGEPVIAIGNPFGLSHTITTGVISALDRSIRVDEDRIFRGFIQTDAPINPGNSGGPLINILGQVIGINTAIYGNAQGIGFAIPIDKVNRIIDDLIEYGQVRSAWIGVNVQDITPAIAQYFHYQSAEGVLIAQVLPDSSAEKAGLKQGDIIVEINGQPVRDQAEYNTIIEEYTARDALKFALVRDGKPLTIKVQAEAFSAEQAVNMANKDFGFSVEEISQDLIYQYRLRTQQGVVITKVRPNSPAANVGIEPGDIIRQVEGAQIDTLNDFQDAMMKLAQKSSVVFLIQRRTRGYYITLERQ
ncbi:2-alkenal reductase [Candidatus Vecturithrix granuli]|uniref:2-alkenal reductase n=1 Tax=Vecturithrix granuli TaxID=1499967 RepID=A0A081BUA1_VECG1|nr:2-alkenal reductase [Candidatus Vecturithrix granuli]